MNKSNKGFTLAELLIVVAIIAVLVAIAIPVFATQLEKSREAVDLSTVRAKYAEIMAMAITQEEPPAGSDITRTTVTNGYCYTATVSLKQRKSDWQTSKPITIAEIQWIGADIENHWEGTPEGGGTCEVSYSDATGAKFKWSGATQVSILTKLNSGHDYFAPLQNSMSLSASGSYCVNSTCDKNGTVKNVTKGIQDDLFNSDIKTWAVVRDTSRTANNNNNNYLLSTFDITNLDAGTEIPAIYYTSSGDYYIGTAKVSQAPDRNGGKSGAAYNILTVDRNGNYAYNYDANLNGSRNTAYQYTNLLADSTRYTEREEAQAAYKTLVESYLTAHPDMNEG